MARHAHCGRSFCVEISYTHLSRFSSAVRQQREPFVPAAQCELLKGEAETFLPKEEKSLLQFG